MTDRLSHISIFYSAVMDVANIDGPQVTVQSKHRSLVNLTVYKYILKRATKRSISKTTLRQCKDETIGTAATKLRTHD